MESVSAARIPQSSLECSWEEMRGEARYTTWQAPYTYTQL